jgi:hypothetical protein
MANGYSPVSWQPNEIITADKMSQFSDNVQWVKDNTPRAVYTNPNGFRRSTGVVFLCGMALVTARAEDRASVIVTFGNSFTPGCQPIVNVTSCNLYTARVFHRITGIGEHVPSYNGFTVWMQVDANNNNNDFIQSNTYIHWIAMGY